MSVELQPSAQLGFHRPLTQLVKRTLTVTNTNSQPVAFKVKTTAPKQYCVRPNSGRIEPNERVEVQVLLQPMKEEPPAGTRCKDKFLVQSAIITPDRETKTLADLWSSVEADVKAGRDGVVHEQKIRCAYLPPVEGGASGEGGEAPPYNGAHTGTDNGDTSMATSHSASGFAAVANGATPSRFEDTRTAPSSVISQKPSAGPATTTTNTTNPTINGISSASEGTTDNASAAEKIKAAVPSSVEEAKAAAMGAASAVGAAATGAAASLGLTGASGDSASLQKELANARAEIERLKTIINQRDGGASAGAEGLRQRNVGSSSAATSSSSGAPGAATATVTQQGVPLPMVGALCAGVFVFTYLFF